MGKVLLSIGSFLIGWLVGTVLGALFEEEIREYTEPLRIFLFVPDIKFSADLRQACQLGSLETIVRNVRDDTLGADELSPSEAWRSTAIERTRICSEHEPGVGPGKPLDLLEPIDEKFSGCFDAEFPALWKRWLNFEEAHFLLASQASVTSSDPYALCRTGFTQGEHTGNFLCPSRSPREEIILCVDSRDVRNMDSGPSGLPPLCPSELLQQLQFPDNPQCP